MKHVAFVLMLGMLIFLSTGQAKAPEPQFRPPAVPLVACDPYFSVWSCSDAPTDSDTVHWTGRRQAMTSLIRVDGHTYRLMGQDPESMPVLDTTGVRVLPTRTIYSFEGAGVGVTLTFTQAALPDDIDMLSRPVVYVNWDVKSMDHKGHRVSIYYDNTAEIAVNDPDQTVVWSRSEMSGLTMLSVGTDSQRVLKRKGDDVRIDWGYFYVAAKTTGTCTAAIALPNACRTQFDGGGRLPESDANNMPCAVNADAPVLAMDFDMGLVETNETGCQVVLAYDDQYSIRYFGEPLRPYWRRNGMRIGDLLKQAFADFDALNLRCRAFDEELMADLTDTGGEKYALMAALAYRQCVAANKIVADKNGKPLMFSKENFSNGCIGTADVFYPMAPQYLLLNPELLKATVIPLMDYAASECWPFPFAPHDLGTYPDAGGQVYGGGERSEENQMPVEECGNMLILVAAVAEAEGSADLARRYWPLLTQWAEYLKEKGLDPENQLCTDDFSGHLAHNVNLSAKAILALASYGKLADMQGKYDVAQDYRNLARTFAQQWETMARDGDHYRLAFDLTDTWSQKYNLVWDRLLNLNLFDENIGRRELAYYRKMQEPYGLPLDNRSTYTKLDWIFWSACITGDSSDFVALTDPVFKFLNETPDRVPMTDWYWTHDAHMRGFQARPVVGGVFIRMLDNRVIWEKWARRCKKTKGDWAALPKPPVIVPVVPTGRDGEILWAYTTDKPVGDWFAVDYDDSSWDRALSGFGTQGTPGATVRTVWNSRDIWIRRSFELEVPSLEHLQLLIHHDEDAEVYINGIIAASVHGYSSGYETLELTASGKAALRQGANTMAVHCRQSFGGQYIDVGIVNVVAQD